MTATVMIHTGTIRTAMKTVKDIEPREMGILVPIALAVILLGVLPAGVMRSMSTPIEIIRGPIAKIDAQQDAVAENE